MAEKSTPTGEDVDMRPTVAIDGVIDTMEQFMQSASVDAVYGKAIKQGDTLIIPAAEILSGMGFGMGYGAGSSSDESEDGENSGSGSGGGGGGGGRVLSRPVAVIVADGQTVRVEPVVDVTKIALAALTASGFMLGMVAKMLKGRSE